MVQRSPPERSQPHRESLGAEPRVERWLLGAALLAAGCSSAPLSSGPPSTAPPAVTPAPSPPPAGATPALGRGWEVDALREIYVAQLALLVRLPPGFSALPARGPWAGFAQEETKAQLWLLHVTARRSVTLDECAAEARGSLGLLRSAGVGGEVGPLLAPSGYTGRVWWGAPEGERARLWAIGVDTGRCFAAVFDVEGIESRARARFVGEYVLPSVRRPSWDERAGGREQVR